MGHPLTEAQRDALIVDSLEHLYAIDQTLRDITALVTAQSNALGATDFQRWKSVIDLKLTELEGVNLSQAAALRMGNVAKSYMEQLSKEIGTIAKIEVEKSLKDAAYFAQMRVLLTKDWLLRLGSIALVVLLTEIISKVIL